MAKSVLLADEEEIEQTLETIKKGDYDPQAQGGTEEEDDFNDDFIGEEDILKESAFKEVPDEEWGKRDIEPKSQEEEKVEAEQKVEAERKLPPDVEAIQKLIDTGEISTGKVKGQEVDFSQLTPEERLALQQKGYRFYQFMEELAQKEDNLKQVEAHLTQNAQELIRLRNSGQLPERLSPTGQTTVPKELQDNDFDTPEVKALKAVSRDLMFKVGNLEQNTQQQQLIQGEQELLGNISKVQETYPLASTEEIIAVRALYNDIPVERIAMKSHQKYSSIDHTQRVFDSCPDVKRHFYEDAVNKYLAKQKTRKTIPSKSLSSTGKMVAESLPKPKGMDYDWDDAQADINKRLRKLYSMSEEDRLE